MATRDDNEELSNETETVELSSEDEHDIDHEDGDLSDKPKKKGGLGKILGIVGGVVAIGAIGFTVTKMFSEPTPAPAPQSQTSNEQKIPVTVEQPKQEQAVVPPVVQQQQTEAPVSQVPQVSNGAEVLPDLHTGTVTNENPNVGTLGEDAKPQSSSVSKAPEVNTNPVTSSVESDAPDLGNHDVAPMPAVGSNVTESKPVVENTQSQAPAISGDGAAALNSSIQSLIVKMDGLSTSIESVSNMIGDTNDRIDKTNTRIDGLEKRLEKLEGASKDDKTASTKADTKKDSVTKPIVKSANKTKAVVKKKRISNVSSHSRYNSVEIIDEDAPRAHRTSYSAPKKSVAVSNARLGGGYTLQSVVTDRAWVKHPNGTTSTYGIGDRLPNGHIVGSIDPDNGVYDTNGKLVLK